MSCDIRLHIFPPGADADDRLDSAFAVLDRYGARRLERGGYSITSDNGSGCTLCSNWLLDKSAPFSAFLSDLGGLNQTMCDFLYEFARDVGCVIRPDAPRVTLMIGSKQVDDLPDSITPGRRMVRVSSGFAVRDALLGLRSRAKAGAHGEMRWDAQSPGRFVTMSVMPGTAIRWWEFGLWGLCGGAAVLAIEFWSTMRERHGRLPVRFTRFWYWVGEFCRILVGGVLAIALGRASQVTVPLGAFTVGVAAPLILSRLGEFVPRIPTALDANEEKP